MSLPQPRADEVVDFVGLTLRRAILLWVDRGIKANRAYTPGAMARAATTVTGLSYTSSKKSLKKAADDIAAMYPGVCK